MAGKRANKVKSVSVNLRQFDAEVLLEVARETVKELKGDGEIAEARRWTRIANELAAVTPSCDAGACAPAVVH